MSQNQTTEYKSVFKIVPTSVWDIEGITFAAIKFYQTIFEFWHAGCECYLSNASISQRTGIKGSADISKFFKYFEDKGLMKRVISDGKRYIVQPPSRKECESLPEQTDVDGVSSAREGGSRESERGGLVSARHNIIREVKKNNKTSVQAAPAPTGNSSFEKFWSVYPRKQDKKKAQDSWNKNKLAKHVDYIIDKLENQIKNLQQWKDPRLIPMPTTYINGERWEDEVESASAPQISAKRIKDADDLAKRRFELQEQQAERKLRERKPESVKQVDSAEAKKGLEKIGEILHSLK